ncbi:MAG: hypothetical protein KAS32_21930, partial [Candidatus Peribacteraceae bacterium]|nr:hypothetical protein [Candidatus Peribacteraceae bacterium]
FIPFLESQLNINRNVWQKSKASPTITITAGRYLQNGCAQIIVNGVNQWLTQPQDDSRMVKFYESGLDLWRLNREILGLKFPRKVKITNDDVAIIMIYLSTFNETWQNHLNKHVRTINRFVDTGQLEGWTTQQFIDNCVCPDGFIIGFRYGNARYSWHEHLRRFGVARPKIVAQAAQAERMARA